MQHASREGAREALVVHLRAELFRALGDPTRLQVLSRLALAAEPLTVTEVSGCCGVHLSGVSRHLAILREAGVVAAAKEGREVRYRLEREALSGVLRGLADAVDRCAGACTETEGPVGACCPAPEREEKSER
jgi:DNA-binding transcriptional ArsR family regulator